MRISVFGLGYVGAVTAGCLASQGHDVIGVDVHPQKVEDFNQGRAPIVEPKLDELLRRAHAQGRLRATPSCAEAIGASELTLVCVGTPSRSSGELDLSHVAEVTRQIGEALRHPPKEHTLVYRSTMLPGSTQRLVDEHLRDPAQRGLLTVLYYPEFMREGFAVADFLEPSLAVVGTHDGKAFPAQWNDLLGGRTTVTDWKTAEMVKYACNAFHATKVTFANEIGRLGKQMGVDSQAVMRILCGDTRLNLSAYYLRPGNPFGGSCLPKDVGALGHYGRKQGLSLPLMESLLASNQHHLQSLFTLIADRGHKEVVILGLSFKAHTDDLRGSAMVEVAQNLLGRGYQVRIYDPQLNLARVVGSNRRVVDTKMPHLASLLKEDLRTALGEKGLVVAAQPCATISELSKHITPAHHVLDINGWPELRSLPARYEGFCW